MKPVIGVNSIIHSLIRYLLGVTMMAYGLIKILQTQFSLPPEVYHYQLEQLDGVTLAWAFLGFSFWFSTFLGVFELVPGFLLLFRRTSLLGAILLFPSLLMVFLVNNAYHFLPGMRIFTGVLLLLDVLLLISGYKCFFEFLRNILGQSSFTAKEVIINAIILGLLIILLVSKLI